MACNCNNIYPDCDMNRWEVCQSIDILTNYYTKQQTDGLLDNKLDVSAYTPSDLSNYYTKQQTNDLLDNKLDVSAYTPTDLSNYWTSAQTKNYVDNAISGVPSGALAVVWEDVAFNMNDELWDSLVDAFNNDKPIYSIYHYSGDNQTYVSQTPIAGNVSINETESSMKLWRDEEDFDTYYVEITKNGSNDYTVTDGNIQWQQYLIPGTGIAINGNVISATGGGTGITIDQSLDSGSTNAVANSAITNAINAKADATNVYTKTEVNNIINNKIICLTQRDYDSLITRESDTLYLIYEV